MSYFFRSLGSGDRHQKAPWRRKGPLRNLGQTPTVSVPLNKEDCLIGASIVLTLGGVVLGALLADPSVIGLTALAVIIMLIVGWGILQSQCLAWLLVFGAVAGPAPMLSNTPVWIIFTYGGCTFTIGVLALICYRPGAWGRAVLAGLFAAAGFMFSGVFWFSLLG